MIASRVLAEVPALPLHTAGEYVAGAYVVLFALVLIYVAIMAIRLSRMESQLGELLEAGEKRPVARSGEHDYTAERETEVQGSDVRELTETERESTPA